MDRPTVCPSCGGPVGEHKPQDFTTTGPCRPDCDWWTCPAANCRATGRGDRYFKRAP